MGLSRINPAEREGLMKKTGRRTTKAHGATGRSLPALFLALSLAGLCLWAAQDGGQRTAPLAAGLGTERENQSEEGDFEAEETYAGVSRPSEKPPETEMEEQPSGTVPEATFSDYVLEYSGYLDDLSLDRYSGEIREPFSGQDYDGDGLIDRLHRGLAVKNAETAQEALRIDFGNGDRLELGSFDAWIWPTLLTADLTGDGRNEIVFQGEDISKGTAPCECRVFKWTQSGYEELTPPYSPVHSNRGSRVLGFDVFVKEVLSEDEVRFYCPVLTYDEVVRVEDEYSMSLLKAAYKKGEVVSGVSGELGIFTWEGKNYLAYRDYLGASWLDYPIDALLSFHWERPVCVWMGSGLNRNIRDWYGEQEIRALNGELLTWSFIDELKGLEYKLDANLDGTPEKIAMEVDEDAGTYSLHVGTDVYVGYGHNVRPWITVLSLDRKSLLLAVYMGGSDNDPQTDFFVYEDGKIMKAGSLPGDILEAEIDRWGKVKCTDQTGTIQPDYAGDTHETI